MFFLFLLQNIDLGTRYNRLTEAVLTCTHNLCLRAKIKKNITIFYLKIIIFAVMKSLSKILFKINLIRKGFRFGKALKGVYCMGMCA